jgi:hypothetical protein
MMQRQTMTYQVRPVKISWSNMKPLTPFLNLERWLGFSRTNYSLFLLRDNVSVEKHPKTGYESPPLYSEQLTKPCHDFTFSVYKHIILCKAVLANGSGEGDLGGEEL